MKGLITVLFGLMVNYSAAEANEFIDDLYNIDHGKLDNGLTYILKSNGESRNVAIFITVEGGLEQFSCKKQQVPHVLEHIIFSGNQDYSTSELRKQFTDKAGNIRAMTWFGQTYYEVQIHSAYTDFALKTLYKVITRPQFNNLTLKKAINEVSSELGVGGGSVRQLFAPKRPVVDRAISKVYPGTNLDCEEEMSPSGVNLTDVQNAYRDRYSPDNMNVIVVGNINESQTKRVIQETFGLMPKYSSQINAPNVKLNKISTDVVSDYTKPFAVEANVGFVIRAVGYNNPDYPSMELLLDYLHDYFSTEIHKRQGMGYNPRVKYDANPYYGHFVARVETTYEWVDELNKLLREMSQKLVRDGVSEASFETIRNRKLLELESKTWSNKELAKMYMKQRLNYGEGTIPNQYRIYQNITYEMFQSTINKYLQEWPKYYVRQPPSFSQMGQEAFVVFCAIFVVGSPFVYLRRKYWNKRNDS